MATGLLDALGAPLGVQIGAAPAPDPGVDEAGYYMHSLSISIWDAPPELGGKFIMDISNRCQGAKFSDGKHGFAAFSCFVSLSLIESFRFYDMAGKPYLVVDWLTYIAWEGRIEDVAVVSGGLRIGAFGYMRELSDTPYSTTGTPADPADTVRDVIADLSGVSTSELSSSTGLVTSTGLNIAGQTYTNADAIQAVSELAALGNTSAQIFEAGIYEGRMLFYRVRASAGAAWYVDITDIDLERSLEPLYNAVYAVYNSGASTTATSTDTFSVLRNRVTRTKALTANTTDATQAGYLRDTALADSKSPAPRASFKFTEVFNVNGIKFPPWMVRAGDTLTARNLSPVLSTDIDNIRTMIVGEKEYDIDNNLLTVSAYIPLPTLDVITAQIQAAQ